MRPDHADSTRPESADIKKIFLGYPFALDYVRGCVERAAKGLARVSVASDLLRGQPLLHKIEAMMSEADLCLFDLTLHNPNVAAEFGIAHGRGYKYAILYCADEVLNPTPGRESSLFTDVKGWDSLLYTEPSELEAKLRHYLPELLLAPVPAPPGPLQVLQTNEEREWRERAFAVQPIMHINIGSGEAGPDGSFINGVIRNVGRGIALKPQLLLPGFGDIPLDHLIKPGEENKIRLRYDQAPCYTNRLTDRVVVVEFEDELANRYEQRGVVMQSVNDNSDVYSYAIRGLDQAMPILPRSANADAYRDEIDEALRDAAGQNGLMIFSYVCSMSLIVHPTAFVENRFTEEEERSVVETARDRLGAAFPIDDPKKGANLEDGFEVTTFLLRNERHPEYREYYRFRRNGLFVLTRVSPDDIDEGRQYRAQDRFIGFGTLVSTLTKMISFAAALANVYNVETTATVGVTGLANHRLVVDFSDGTLTFGELRVAHQDFVKAVYTDNPERFEQNKMEWAADAILKCLRALNYPATPKIAKTTVKAFQQRMPWP